MMAWWITLTLVAAGAVAIFGGVYLYRNRLGQLVEIERVRRAIARDLHDDLGSSLSRISILTEVAKRKQKSGEDIGELLDQVGSSARELIDALSDSIWAIDPKRDDLKSFATRLRRFAGDLLEAQGIRCEIVLPEAAANTRITSERRRHLYLLIKEAVNNSAKHASARRVVVEMSLQGSTLQVEVKDDGDGFQPGQYWAKGSAEVGRGLRTMLQRAHALGGRLDFDTGIGSGTCVRVFMPLDGPVLEKRGAASGIYNFQGQLRQPEPKKRFFFF